jgi:hypothetical protein
VSCVNHPTLVVELANNKGLCSASAKVTAKPLVKLATTPQIEQGDHIGRPLDANC